MPEKAATEVWRSVGGTGHRPATRRNPDGIQPGQLPWIRERCRAGLVWLRDTHGSHVVRSGLALGWDMILAAEALEAGYTLHADIPFESQTEGWPSADVAEWERLRGLATTETVYGPNPETYQQAVVLLHARNDGLLLADAMFALWNGRRKGGTWSAVKKAQRLGRPGVHLDPVERGTRVVAPGGWF